MKFINFIFQVNFLLLETEKEKYAGKYNMEIQETYSKMKLDLTKMLDYEEMWEKL